MKNLKMFSLGIAMLISFLSLGQEMTITGIVSDSNGLPVPGANVHVKGTKIGSQTDFDGSYTIKAVKGDVLVFAFIGMNSSEIRVGDTKIINVRISPMASELCSIVVTSCGVSKKSKSIPLAKKNVTIKLNSNIKINQNYESEQSFVGEIVQLSKSKFETKDNPIFYLNGYKIIRKKLSQIDFNEFDKIEVLNPEESIKVFGKNGKEGTIMITSKNYSSKESKKIKDLDDKIDDKDADSNGLNFLDNKEEYDNFIENPFENPTSAPLSTFSIDVDNASYTNIRRFINNGQKVPKDAVRVEEMINFFKYQYSQPTDNHPFSINTEYSNCAWNSKHQILKIGLQGKNIDNKDLPNSNLVFLIDVSGSMAEQNKLPLLIQSLKILVNELRKEEKVAIVVYAGAAGIVLEPTSGDKKMTIIDALDKLHAGGSTAGGAGIQLAYKLAEANFIKGGNNRVILATDGDFNVGTSSDSDMQTLIEEKRKSGVFLTCLGYGMRNYKDKKMEILADKGNGNYAYIDNIQEANRFLSKEFKGSMFAIAKDVKIQIEFNPKYVQSYRLIGYENRKLRPEDFKNDAIDAGELGSGHTVTALYEIIPTGISSEFVNKIDDLKYLKVEENKSVFNDELATVKFRYKKPDDDKSIEMINIIENKNIDLDKSSDDFKFSSAVAWFGLKLRASKLISNTSNDDILSLARKGLTNDSEGYKTELVRLVETVQ